MGRSGASARDVGLGAQVVQGGVRFAVWSSAAESVAVCIFDEEGDSELGRFTLSRGEDDVFTGFVPGLAPGARYGLRADGPYNPGQGEWFDPAKLLVDPYAVALDRPYAFDARLAAPRAEVFDTAHLMPKAVVQPVLEGVRRQAPSWRPGTLIYELPVRAFSLSHPALRPELQGTVGALADPAVIDHLLRLGVGAVELMPVAAWMDERHLPPLGLSNAWGYNPVSFMALDPRLAPGGIGELRDAVAALHAAGIAVILDVVFNHTAESEHYGPTLSLRGLDSRAYFRHAGDGSLVNDTGTGNTLDCSHHAVRRLVRDSLRHFVRHAGVDGFRFDLAPVLERTADGFAEGHHGFFAELAADPELSDRILIAEPWDVGPGGYRLGRFPSSVLEWNDRYRDDVRRFWRGDSGTLGALATRLAGSSDVFHDGTTRSVNFIAAHDGMTLRDLVSYAHKLNGANGEDNRDGHDENFSWHNGVEGETNDPEVRQARERDMRALLATLFISRGTPMLTAGDEFGRTQGGNNNAYAQDNPLTWLDWENRDRDLEAFVAQLSALRSELPVLSGTTLLSGEGDVEWLQPDGTPMTVANWEMPDARSLAMLLFGEGPAAAVLINGGHSDLEFTLPGVGQWELRAGSAYARPLDGNRFAIGSRSVSILSMSSGTST